jgi:LPXTG-motif cell wall-anchored protein
MHEETPTETPPPPLDTWPTPGSSLTGIIVGGASLVVVGTGLLLFLRRRRDVGAPPAA